MAIADSGPSRGRIWAMLIALLLVPFSLGQSGGGGCGARNGAGGDSSANDNTSTDDGSEPDNNSDDDKNGGDNEPLDSDGDGFSDDVEVNGNPGNRQVKATVSPLSDPYLGGPAFQSWGDDSSITLIGHLVFA